MTVKRSLWEYRPRYPAAAGVPTDRNTRYPATAGVPTDRNMGNENFIFKQLLKPVYFFLFFFILFFLAPSTAQKNISPKAKERKSSSKRVIYGLASFYADKFNGRRTANGEIFRQNKLTCACNMLPFNTWIKVTNLRNDKSVIVKVNDRLHTKMRRIADLSKAAAKKIGYSAEGLVRVKVEVIGKKKPS